MTNVQDYSSSATPPLPLAYQVARDADARPPVSVAALVTGVALVVISGAMLLGGMAVVAELRFRSPDTDNIALAGVVAFSLACLVGGLLAVYVALRRLR